MITAPTPIMMPSIVSSDRMPFRSNACQATRSKVANVMSAPPLGSDGSPRATLRLAPGRDVRRETSGLRDVRVVPLRLIRHWSGAPDSGYSPCAHHHEALMVISQDKA